MIKSVGDNMTAYVFMKKRKQGEGYCICSFFIEPQNEYRGIGVYWLFKSKIRLKDHTEEVLYDRLNEDAAD